MFLVHTLLVFTAIYIVSAVLAETIFSSHNEREIPTAVRVGLGYFLSLFYFLTAWLFMSIRQAWIFGLVLLGLYVYGKTSKGLLNLEWKILKGLLKKHTKILVAFLFSANLFFLPLHIAGQYGPFSEGGGDISVYSDVAKRLTDFNLSAVGLEENASLVDRIQGIKDLKNKAYGKQYKTQKLELFNPPYANYQIDKIAFGLQFNPIQFTPCAQFAFLSSDTNYPVFFAILAFLYSLILASAWGFFHRFGLLPAVLSVMIIGGSHSLVSGFYNMYLLQALATTFLALTLASVPYIAFFSLEGLKTYGFGSAFILLGYSHFLPLILPFILIGFINPSSKRSDDFEDPDPKIKVGTMSYLFYQLPLAVIFSFGLVGFIVGYKSILNLLMEIIKSFSSPKSDSYWGVSVVEFSERWWTLVFGLASQQHFEPYVFESKMVNSFIPWAISFGLLACVVGGGIWFVRRPKNLYSQKSFLIYLLLIGTTILYLMMSQTNQYSQAKASQYLLLAVYFLMLLPFGVFYQRNGGMGLKNISQIFGKRKNNNIGGITYLFLLFGFSCFLWVPRIVYANKIAHQKDRSTIIEPSFFSEAKRIKAKEKNVFVLFEPRISADVYFSYQSFAGYRFIPTRHLVLLELLSKGDFVGESNPIARFPADFIKPEYLPRLWTLSAIEKEKGKYQWQGKKLIDKIAPDLIFSGNDYQRNFGFKSRAKRNEVPTNPNDNGMFSYVRKGSVMAYLPPGGPYHLEVKIFNRDATNSEEFGLMMEEIEKRAASGEFRSFSSIQKKEGVITMLHDFKASVSPRLSLVSKYSSEYWFNARLNGKEFPFDEKMNQ